MTTPLETSGAVVVRDGMKALEGVDFTCDAGEFVALLGPNGAGKTTLVAALLGLLPVTSGTVEVFGVPVRRFREWHRVGYVPQRPNEAVSAPATALEVVLLGRLARRGFRPAWSRADVEASQRALSAVGLADRAHARATSLSGGQQQRLRVARALAGEPNVLVLDEPFSWVDVPTEADLVGVLAEFRAAGGATVFVAHDLHAVEHLVDRVVVLREGRVEAEGTPAEIGLGDFEHRHEHEPHGDRRDEGWRVR